jgi:deazaflavin-dependent oxidoreductase (nitroreductase family)
VIRDARLRRPAGTLRGVSRGPIKRRVATALGKYLFNPPVRLLFALGIPTPGTALLETIGRKSGKPRRTPVTNGLDGETFWIVAEHGRRAAYVRNVEVDPHVRVKIVRRWRTATAQVMVDDDPRTRLDYIAKLRRSSRANAQMVAAMSTELLVLRVTLDS